MSVNKKVMLGMALCSMQGFAAGLQYDFETNSDDWAARGSGETTVELSSKWAHGGQQSLFVDGRTQSWNGALMQNDYLQPGKTYKFSCWVLAPENATMDLSMQYTNGDGEAAYPGIANKQVYSNSWAELSGEIVIPDDATDIQPYVQCSSSDNLSYYIDDFSCEEKVEETLDFSDQPALKDIFRDYFKIGTAVTASEITPANTKKLVLHHYNSVTPGNELKPDCLLDQQASQEKGDNVNPQVRLAASTKTVLKFCSENNIPIRGHVFVWHSQTPDWFFNENFESNGRAVGREVMSQRMENYIKNVIEAVTTTYPSLQIYAWDIVNETFNDNGQMRQPGSNYASEGSSRWMEVYGDSSFIYTAFKTARKYLPAGCKAYYNDYNEYIGQKRDGIYQLVKSMWDLGICDGIGMQSHLSCNYPSVALYKEAVEKYATIGCDIQVTELDITLDGASLETQAKMYKDLFEVYKEYKDKISLVALWGTNDEISWRANGQPLIHSNYQPKPAYWQIIEGMPIPDASGVTASKADAKITITPTCIGNKATIACEGDFGYSVVNMAGQEKLKGNGHNKAVIDATSLAAGVYMVEVQTRNGEKKTVKVKVR